MKHPACVRGELPGCVVLVFACLCLSSCLRPPLGASDTDDDFANAVAAGKRKDHNAAFMHFRRLTARPGAYRETSLFAVGEYYVIKNVQADAIQALSALVRDYPESRYRVFALWYLEIMARRLGRDDLAREYQQHIIMMRQHSFLFRNSKEFSVVSPLQRKLKVVYYIDKVEFYIDGDPGAVLSY